MSYDGIDVRFTGRVTEGQVAGVLDDISDVLSERVGEEYEVETYRDEEPTRELSVADNSARDFELVLSERALLVACCSVIVAAFSLLVAIVT